MKSLNNVIEIDNVYVTYNGQYALEAVTVFLSSPSYTLLIGPNGAGKTTLIKALVGLIKPSRGRIRVYGIDPFTNRATLSKLVGYLPQPGTSRPSPFIKVREMVAMGYLSTKLPPRYVDRRTNEIVLESLRAMNIEDLADRHLNSLSNGELQRAIIASIIAKRPKLLVLDEPLASLDFNAKCELMELLLGLHKRIGVDVIMSTHELTQCTYFEPTVILLNKKVVTYGPASLVLTPENLRKTYPSMAEIGGLTILAEDHAIRRGA